MKRITAIAITLAAVLGCSYTGAHAATEGRVETNAIICGDHYLLLEAIDQTISGSSVNNRRALFTTLEHGVKKGVGFTDFLIVTSQTIDGLPGEGYILHITPNVQNLQAASFALDQTSTTGLSYTVSGPKFTCRAA